MVAPDGDHQRQADRRVDGVAPADPLPEAEHVGGVDAEGGDLLGVRADGDEVPGDGVVAELGGRASARAVRALVSVSIVVNVFDDTTNSVSAGSSPSRAPAMSAPSTLETKRHRQLAVGGSRSSAR